MNRALVRLVTSSTRILPRIYASSTPTTAGHHGSGNVHHHDSHGHHHHHEPQLRKTQDWSHHSGIQSKYENQSEDPSIAFVAERPNYYDYRPTIGQVPLVVPYRTHAQLYDMRLYHAALLLSIWLWWYVAYRFVKEPSYFFGHAHFPDMSQFTDEELGVPPDDVD